jgi:hypothetical protein
MLDVQITAHSLFRQRLAVHATYRCFAGSAPETIASSLTNEYFVTFRIRCEVLEITATTGHGVAKPAAYC